jgi:hypothetical protein
MTATGSTISTPAAASAHSMGCSAADTPPTRAASGSVHDDSPARSESIETSSVLQTRRPCCSGSYCKEDGFGKQTWSSEPTRTDATRTLPQRQCISDGGAADVTAALDTGTAQYVTTRVAHLLLNTVTVEALRPTVNTAPSCITLPEKPPCRRQQISTGAACARRICSNTRTAERSRSTASTVLPCTATPDRPTLSPTVASRSPALLNTRRPQLPYRLLLNLRKCSLFKFRICFPKLDRPWKMLP